MIPSCARCLRNTNRLALVMSSRWVIGSSLAATIEVSDCFRVHALNQVVKPVSLAAVLQRGEVRQVGAVERDGFPNASLVRHCGLLANFFQRWHLPTLVDVLLAL